MPANKFADPEIKEQILETLHQALSHGEQVTLHVDGVCMSPGLGHSRSVTVAGASQYRPGDIAAYYCPHQGKNFVHRFLGPVYRGGTQRYLFMADNAALPDALVDPDHVLGKVASVSGEPLIVSFFCRLKSTTRYLYWLVRLFIRSLA